MSLQDQKTLRIMLNFLFTVHCLFITLGVLTAHAATDTMIVGEGAYKVISVKQCADNDNYVFKIDVQRRKLNRTIDAYNITACLEKVFDDTYGFRLEMSRLVDGGYKLLHLIQDDNYAKTMMRYANKNTNNFLTMAGVPPEFPINPGTLEIIDFVIDMEELPNTGFYGSYSGHAVLLDMHANIVGCLDIIAEFNAFGG